MIEVHLEHTVIPVGQPVSGTLTWRSNQDKPPKDGRVILCWHTEGRGTRDRQVVQEYPIEIDRLVAVPGLAIPFSVTIPYQGPVTYNGSLFRIVWEVQISLDKPGLFSGKDKQSWPLQVIPR